MERSWGRLHISWSRLFRHCRSTTLIRRGRKRGKLTIQEALRYTRAHSSHGMACARNEWLRHCTERWLSWITDDETSQAESGWSWGLRRLRHDKPLVKFTRDLWNDFATEDRFLACDIGCRRSTDLNPYGIPYAVSTFCSAGLNCRSNGEDALMLNTLVQSITPSRISSNRSRSSLSHYGSMISHPTARVHQPPSVDAPGRLTLPSGWSCHTCKCFNALHSHGANATNASKRTTPNPKLPSLALHMALPACMRRRSATEDCPRCAEKPAPVWLKAFDLSAWGGG